MDRSGLLSAWWMPVEEEKLWETMPVVTPQRVIFLTGIFILLNSFSFSLVRLLFDRKHFTDRDHLWTPHRFVDCFYSAFVFFYCLLLFYGAEEDHTFLKDRVFVASANQEFLSDVQSAYSVYAIGVCLLNFKSFGAETVRINVMKGCLMLGINYLNLLFPCVLGARLRIYWGLSEVATVVTAVVDFLKLRPVHRTLLMFTMASMFSLLVRFWSTMMTLLWGYQWLTSETIWNGIPSVVPVSKLTNAYLTGMVIGSIGWSYCALLDFRMIVSATKEWTDAHRKPKKSETHKHLS